MSLKPLRYYGNGHFCVPRTFEHQSFCTESSRGTEIGWMCRVRVYQRLVSIRFKSCLYEWNIVYKSIYVCINTIEIQFYGHNKLFILWISKFCVKRHVWLVFTCANMREMQWIYPWGGSLLFKNLYSYTYRIMSRYFVTQLYATSLCYCSIILL